MIKEEAKSGKKTYKCLYCGLEKENPTRTFYKISSSDLYIKNDGYAPWCIECTNKMFKKLSKKYNSDKIACILMCYKLDIPFYHDMYDSIVKNNSSFTMGLIIRRLNNHQYANKTFENTILNNELCKSEAVVQKEKEKRWSEEDENNRDEVIEIVGYDPFEGFLNDDRRFLFNELVKYFDDDLADDAFKLSQIIQIVINNNQIRLYNLLIANMNPKTDSEAISTLTALKKDLAAINDKIAKENEISVKNRSNKDIGKSTLSYLMRDLREKDFHKAEMDYYDQLKSEGSMWAISMSNKAIVENGMFDESDKQELFDIQREHIQKLQDENDALLEKVRLLSLQVEALQTKDVTNE